jgi:hypothetical protein
MAGGEEVEGEGKVTGSGGSGGRVDPKSFVPKKQSYDICECSIHASFALLCFSSHLEIRTTDAAAEYDVSTALLWAAASSCAVIFSYVYVKYGLAMLSS